MLCFGLKCIIYDKTKKNFLGPLLSRHPVPLPVIVAFPVIIALPVMYGMVSYDILWLHCIVLHAFTVVDKKNVAFSSLKSHTLHSRNPIQHQKQIQQAYAEKYCWIKLFEDDAAHMLSEMGNCSICRKECDFYFQFAYFHFAFKIKRLSKIPIDGAVCKAQHSTISMTIA